MKIQRLLVDANNVLYDSTAWTRWLYRLISQFGVSISFADFDELWKGDHQPEVYSGGCCRWQATRDFLMSLGLAEGEVCEVFAAAKPKFRDLQGRITLFPSVRRSLAILSTQMKVSVFCETELSLAQVKQEYQRLGILRFISELRTSSQESNSADPCEFFNVGNEAAIEAGSIGFASSDQGRLNKGAELGLRTIAIGLDDVSLPSYPNFESYVRFLGSDLGRSQSLALRSKAA